jgi:hypothetical protein
MEPLLDASAQYAMFDELIEENSQLKAERDYFKHVCHVQAESFLKLETELAQLRIEAGTQAKEREK